LSAEDAAVLDLLDGELRVLAELHGAALAQPQLHARVAAGAQAILPLQHGAGRERHGVAAALEPRGILHRLDRRGLGEGSRCSREQGEREERCSRFHRRPL